MSDKRSVTTDALETLGTFIDDQQKRDAIHLAVEPVIAGERLPPGTHITVSDGIASKTKVGQGLGIVDPFLPRPVNKGERFWFVMYPRMVQSLRHVWTHSAFPDEIGTVTLNKSKIDSELWLRKFCAGADCPGYETVMELIENASLPGTNSEYTSEHLYFHGSDAHGEIPDEFWGHVEIVLGRKLKARPTYFSCSC